MKCIFFIVLASLAMIAEPHPFLGRDVAADIGQGLGKIVGGGIALGLGTVAEIGAGALGLGAGVVDGVANVVGQGLRGSSASRNIQEGSTRGEAQNEAEEAGAYNEESHKKAEQNYHDRSHHHSSVTTITRVENSDEHDVGAHEAVEESAHAGGAFNKQASAAAKKDDNDYEGDSEEEADN